MSKLPYCGTFLVVITIILLDQGIRSLPAGPPAAKPGAGNIAGEILFTGTVPPDQKILTTDGATLFHNDLVVDPKTKGLRYVAVILEGPAPQPKLTNAKPAEMDQKDMIFIPGVLAVQHGQPVIFNNSDLCNHCVMTASLVPENVFNVVTPPGQPFKFTFKAQPKPIPIGCPLHGWMKAWVYVVEHPWFDVTNAQGQFTLRDVPPGTYTLWLHHADTGKQEKRPVTVKAGETAKLKVEWASAGK